MSEELGRRVRAAAVAGWWTVLIGAAWAAAVWAGSLVMLHVRPGWILALWGGGGLGWDTVQGTVLWFLAAFKMVLFVGVMACLWLTLWARRLRGAQ